MRIPRWFLQKFGCTFPISNILTLVAISTTDNLKLDIDIFPLTIAVMTSSLGVATEVIFFSRLWHEVLPSERVRRALTLWILRPEEEESWIPAVFWFAFWPWRSCSLRNMEKRMFLHRTTAKAQVVMLWSVWSIVKLRELRCPSATLIDESGEREELAMESWKRSHDEVVVAEAQPKEECIPKIGEEWLPVLQLQLGVRHGFSYRNMFSASLPTEEHGGDLIRALFIIGSEVGIALDSGLCGQGVHFTDESSKRSNIQESKSPTFDDVTLGGILCLSQFSSLVKIQLRWVDEHECSVTLWYLESRRPEAESRMQLQSAMHGHIGLAIWFAKPVSRQVMTNEQGAVKHLAAWLAHVCIWICVDLDLRNGQTFPAFFRLRRWMWFLHRSCHWVLRKGTRCRGPCGLRGCGLRQSFAERLSVIPTRTNEHTFSNAKWFQTYQRWPATWSCWDEGSVSQWVKGFKTPSKLLSCVMYHPKMPNHLGGNLFAAWAQGKGECFCFISILTCLHIPHTIS